MDNFVIIYRILKYLEKAMDYEEVDEDSFSAKRFNITANRWTAIMKMIVDNGYIEGVQIYCPADGGTVVNSIKPQITLKGSEYLEENSTMRKAYKVIKGIKDITPGM